MASSGKNVAILLSLFLVLCVFLRVSVAVRNVQLAPSYFPKLGIGCKQVYGAQDGDTCFTVNQKFNITASQFNLINPNLNCTNIFVGQWLCTDGGLKFNMD